MMMRRIISPSLSPNTEAEDVTQAIRVLLTPLSWREGNAIASVEAWFVKYLGASCAVSFDSGRSALLALLQAFGIGRGDEVILQAFTCAAVPNSIREVGATPVYVDIDDTFNIDHHDLSKKITKRTRAVIVQHTFGVAAHKDEILKFTRKYGLMVIEDCAHSLGATYKGEKVGTLGDGAFFSFGRDKVLSSVWGGIASLNIKYQKSNIKNKLEKIHEELPYPSRAWIAQQLLHPIAFALILPTYNIVVGKMMLETMKQMKLLSLPNPQSFVPRRYPNALAQLLIKQLGKLERYNSQRRSIASYYHDALGFGEIDAGAIYLRYPMLVDDPAHLIRRAKLCGILLGKWYHNVIDPEETDVSNAWYTPGSCPMAEEAARRIINLPTLITREKARRVLYAI